MHTLQECPIQRCQCLARAFDWLHVSQQCDSDGCRTADQIWNVYLGGSAANRPFGNAVLDGVDLDVEHYTAYYPDFVVQLNSKHPWSELSLAYALSSASG